MYLWVSRNFRSKYRYINPGAQYFSRDHGAGVNGRKKIRYFLENDRKNLFGKQQKKIPPFSKKQWDFLSAVLDDQTHSSSKLLFTPAPS